MARWAVDTANGYTDGTAEQLIGDFAQSRSEQPVIATKYSMATRPGDPNSGGALDAELDAKHQARLAEVSAIDLGFPHEALRRMSAHS
ncbi:aldo/keto reductase [Nocardia sp. NPDC088792]|uniref:aldo/keto reductase n=1 Tax=Nocardia sp. NPDC088792 TaxID=3364332 RepID=UPI0037F5CB75